MYAYQKKALKTPPTKFKSETAHNASKGFFKDMLYHYKGYIHTLGGLKSANSQEYLPFAKLLGQRRVPLIIINAISSSSAF